MHKSPLKLLLTTAILIPAALIILTSCKKDSSTPSPAASTAVIKVVTKSGVPMVYLPGGSFTMGSDRESLDEKPAHKVSLNAFLMDQYEVYGELFVKAELSNPSHYQGAKMPVEQIRWRDARMYCNERSLMEDLTPCYDESNSNLPLNINANGYRLPTEAEWEYAARAGRTKRYGSVDAVRLKQYAVYEANSQKRTRPVGTKKPNAFGLYDILGNVSEWCEDVYAENYYADSPEDNPQGPDAKSDTNKRVMRGGNWKASADMCRVTFRTGQLTGDTDACFTTDYCGFRCVRRVSPQELEKLQQH